MTLPRLPGNDPRTIAREIPGFFEALFPHLVPGVVAHLNRRALPWANCDRVSRDAIDKTSLSRAMLFELAVAITEQSLLSEDSIDWDFALQLAIIRQRRHFDARAPTSLEHADKLVASQVAGNLVAMLRAIEAQHFSERLTVAPAIAGFQWIASTVGDFSVGKTLVEVKCTGSNFSSADYRQILIYWLLSYADALEHEGRDSFHQLVLMNPRRCTSVAFESDHLVRMLAGGRSKVELLELFTTMVNESRT